MEDNSTPTLVAPNDESVGLMESGGVKSDQEAQGPAGGGGMCSCLSVEYYKPVSFNAQIDRGTRCSELPSLAVLERRHGRGH